MTWPRADAAPSAEAPPYRGFWDGVASGFPDLGGAVSTRLYRGNEEWLLRKFLPPQPRLLKTDLWDECKNTRILQWAASGGARAFGVDIAFPMVRRARAEFPEGALRAAVADVRRLPFPAETFDAVYSMGTIEHFAEPERALAEIARVLRPGGVAIIGVPNRRDPFLRPVVVDLLFHVGLYAYGYERSFSRRVLRRMVEQAGLRPQAETGILFIPGWLRMFELLCRHRLPALNPLAEALVRPFAWLDQHTAFFRRFGYLIVCVARKPAV
jgi:SAM-dependent methyltransferase